MTKFDFVEKTFIDCKEEPETMTIEQARKFIENVTAAGWEMPYDGITPEEFMELWNERVEQYNFIWEHCCCIPVDAE